MPVDGLEQSGFVEIFGGEGCIQGIQAEEVAMLP